MKVYENLVKPKKARFGQKREEEQQPQNALFRQPVQPIQVDLTDNTLWYGSDNAFPLNLATLVQESPAAASAISTLADFIEGNGFSDTQLNDKVINGQGQRFGDIHNLVCEAYALFEGFTILVKYNRSLEISEIFSVPFENVRLHRPDSSGIISKVSVNPYYGTGIFRRMDTQCYDVFNPDPKVVLSQMQRDKNKYKGQILYVAFTRPLSRFYPQPYYYSAKSWMAIDAGIGEYHANDLDAGFFQTVLLKMIGDPNLPSTHPDDQGYEDDGITRRSIRTMGQRFDIEMQKFTGSDSKTKMMVLWEMIKDQLPTLEAFPKVTDNNFFTSLSERADLKISQAIKIPSILNNLTKENALSDGNQMANATKVMHIRVQKSQNLLERTYGQLLSKFKVPYTEPVKIMNTNSFESMAKIDPLAWAALTPVEQRNWLKENTDYPIEDVENVPVQEAPTNPMPTNKFSNMFFTDYPQGARDIAERALKWMTDNPGCGTTQGMQTTRDIIEGVPLSFKNIKRIYNFLKKNRIHENKLFSDSCDGCKYSSWGGTPMFDYCASKIKMVNE